MRLLIVLLLLCSQAFAADQNIYIDADAATGGDGSIETPYDEFADINWFSLQLIIDGGDSPVVLITGEFDENLEIDADGTQANPLTVKSYGNGGVINPSTLSARNASVYTNDTYVIIDGITVYHNFDKDVIKLHDGAENCVVKNCIIIGTSTTNQGVAVFSGGIDAEIANNDISGVHIGIDVYSISGRINYIHHNYIHDFNSSIVASTDGIHFGGDADFTDTVVEYNNITGWHQDAIDCWGADNIVIKFNMCYNATGLYEANGLKLGGSAGSHNTAYGNIIYNLTLGTNNRAIVSNGGENAIIQANVIYSTDYGIWIYTGDNNATIIGNTCFNITTNALQVDTGVTGVVAKNNILSGTSNDFFNDGTVVGGYNCLKNDSSVSGVGPYSGSGDDLYETDPILLATGKISKTSPCVDAGIWVAGINDGGEEDLWGFKVYGLPDIGAYQGAATPVKRRILNLWQEVFCGQR